MVVLRWQTGRLSGLTADMKRADLTECRHPHRSDDEVFESVGFLLQPLARQHGVDACGVAV